MDIQTRKLNIIEYLIGLKDEKIFNNIEDLINKFRPDQEPPPRPFTQKELIERARKSNKDYLAGNITSQEELEIESNKW